MQEQNENKAEFLSNRTCCVCRRPDKPFQIHHIDEDHSNDDIENLAVLCVECHIQTQQKGGFVRSLSPSVVKLYNESWRKIVKSELLPNGDQNTFIEYEAEVHLEIKLTCHYWKNRYMNLYPGILEDESEYSDMWNRIEPIGKHTYSELEYKKYLPLFDKAIEVLIDKFQKIIMMHSDVIASEVKILLMRTIRQLEGERYFYMSLPSTWDLFSNTNINADKIFQSKNESFKHRFSAVISVLSNLSRKVDDMRDV